MPSCAGGDTQGPAAVGGRRRRRGARRPAPHMQVAPRLARPHLRPCEQNQRPRGPLAHHPPQPAVCCQPGHAVQQLRQLPVAVRACPAGGPPGWGCVGPGHHRHHPATHVSQSAPAVAAQAEPDAVILQRGTRGGHHGRTVALSVGDTDTHIQLWRILPPPPPPPPAHLERNVKGLACQAAGEQIAERKLRSDPAQNVWLQVLQPQLLLLHDARVRGGRAPPTAAHPLAPAQGAAPPLRQPHHPPACCGPGCATPTRPGNALATRGLSCVAAALACDARVCAAAGSPRRQGLQPASAISRRGFGRQWARHAWY